MLIDVGVELVAHDPMAASHALRAMPELVIVPTAKDALCGADVAIIATEWPE